MKKKTLKPVNPYQARLDKICEWMTQEGLSLVMFEDTEKRRDQTLRWLSGHPGDALLFLSVKGETVLVPWDDNLARVYSETDVIIPYSEFNRIPAEALRGVTEFISLQHGVRIEIPPVTPYPEFLNFVGELAEFDILCREQSAIRYAQELRAIKDDNEIKIIRQACHITNEIINLLEKKVRSGKIKTEADAALLIEQEVRKRGCDGTAFDTIAAGPQRSFGIHAFPSYTGEPFAGQGLSILDFGVKYHGYASDVTLTFVRDPKPQQEKLVACVERAYQIAVSMAEEHIPVKQLALAAAQHFAKNRKTMPHSLGHGIGLDAHEHPIIKVRADNELLLKKGMFFTLEPGLYDPLHGGCRLENDVLLSDAGTEILTEAKIVWL